MKKIIAILAVAAIAFGVWKYFHRPDRVPTLPEQALDAAGSYVPEMIDTKKQAEQRINDSMQKENDRLKTSMQELQQ
jgi:hypothetical protein